MKTYSYFLLAIAIAAGLLSAAPAPTSASSSFFEGKTINMVVPFGPGGGLDVWTRTLARFLPKHIPGNPVVLVVNQPGAGGGKAFTILYERGKPDGLTTVSGTPGTHARWLTKEPGHTTYDLNKMRLLAINPSGTVHFLSSRLGVKKAEGLPSLGKTIRSGFTDLGSTIAVTDRMAGELFGYTVKQIPGYTGYGECVMGMLRGELDMSGANANGYANTVLPLVQSGEAVDVFQSGIFDATGNIIRDPRIPDVRTIEQICSDMHNKKPQGKAWDAIRAVIGAQTVGFAIWLPPGVPEERVQTLAAAIRAVVNSEEFKVEAEKILGGKSIVLLVDEARVAFRAMADAPPEITDLFKSK